MSLGSPVLCLIPSVYIDWSDAFETFVHKKKLFSNFLCFRPVWSNTILKPRGKPLLYIQIFIFLIFAEQVYAGSTLFFVIGFLTYSPFPLESTDNSNNNPDEIMFGIIGGCAAIALLLIIIIVILMVLVRRKKSKKLSRAQIEERLEDVMKTLKDNYQIKFVYTYEGSHWASIIACILKLYVLYAIRQFVYYCYLQSFRLRKYADIAINW